MMRRIFKTKQKLIKTKKVYMKQHLFEKFILEKITRNEMRDALNSKDITIGLEFEANWKKNYDFTSEILPMLNKVIGDSRKDFSEEYPYRGDAEARGKWHFVHDGSLSLIGSELVTPKLTSSEFFKYVPQIFKLINKVGGTDARCGLHVSLSYVGQAAPIDQVKLLLFFEEEKVYKHWEERRTEILARDVGHVYSKSIEPILQKIRQDNTITKEMLRKFKELTPQDFGFSTGYVVDYFDRYYGINFEHMKGNNKYIEFRYIGGANYYKKWNDFLATVMLYAAILRIAYDPTYKDKEYAKKIFRISKYGEEVKKEKLKTSGVADKIEQYKKLKGKVKSINGSRLTGNTLDIINDNHPLRNFIANNDIENAVLEFDISSGEITWIDGKFNSDKLVVDHWKGGVFNGKVAIVNTWANTSFIGDDLNCSTFLADSCYCKNGAGIAEWRGKEFEGNLSCATWHGGTFKKGAFTGTWKGGTFLGNRFFNGVWENGVFNGNVMESSEWKNGTFDYGRAENVTWENGTFQGKSFSGIWWNGTWKNGTFEGKVWNNGTWKNGIWKVGLWKNGIWEKGTFSSGYWQDGIWKDGIWISGTWEGGKWIKGKRKTKSGNIIDTKESPLSEGIEEMKLYDQYKNLILMVD